MFYLLENYFWNYEYYYILNFIKYKIKYQYRKDKKSFYFTIKYSFKYKSILTKYKFCVLSTRKYWNNPFTENFG